MLRLARIALGALLPVLAAHPAVGQSAAAGGAGGSLRVVPDTARVTVGQPLGAEVGVRLPVGASLIGGFPRPAEELPEGVRVLAVDSLVAGGDGGFRGRLRFALFRPGEQALPALALSYRAADGTEGILTSSAVPIEVVPVLPPGEQTLKDIKDLEPLPSGPSWWPWLLLMAALLLGAYLIRRRARRRVVEPVPVAERPTGLSPSAYERALERLRQIEAAAWPARGEMGRHYEEVADVVRRYLEEAEGLPALEQTTGELVWALPPDLSSEGLRDDCRELLLEADLVKFARLHPGVAAAAANLAGVRSLLERWHARAGERSLARQALDPERLDALVGAPAGGEGNGDRSFAPGVSLPRRSSGGR